jgi:hypothetical protein
VSDSSCRDGAGYNADPRDMPQPLPRQSPRLTGVMTIDSLPQFDQLVAELETHKLEWARLSALHGPGGKYDDLRKALLDTTAHDLRASYTITGKKVTDGQVAEEAHADADYRHWLDAQAYEHEQYNVLSIDMEITRAKLRHLQSLISFRTAEARL